MNRNFTHNQLRAVEAVLYFVFTLTVLIIGTRKVLKTISKIKGGY